VAVLDRQGQHARGRQARRRSRRDHDLARRRQPLEIVLAAREEHRRLVAARLEVFDDFEGCAMLVAYDYDPQRLAHSCPRAPELGRIRGRYDLRLRIIRPAQSLVTRKMLTHDRWMAGRRRARHDSGRSHDVPQRRIADRRWFRGASSTGGQERCELAHPRLVTHFDQRTGTPRAAARNVTRPRRPDTRTCSIATHTWPFAMPFASVTPRRAMARRWRRPTAEAAGIGNWTPIS